MAGVLVFTPVWRGVNPACAAAMGPQVGDGVVWVVDDRNPFPAPDYRNIRVKYQDARRTVLDGEFSALVTLEADVIPPAGGVAALLATPGDVVYGAMMLRHGVPLLNLFQWVGTRNTGMSLSNYPAELAAARRAGTWRVSGVGFGFTLIRRHVLEQIDFRDDANGQACDMPFAEDCLRAGFVAMGRLDVECGHVDEDAGGVVLWPRSAMEGGMLYLVLETVNVMVNGRSVRLVAGSRVMIAPEVAPDLVRAGYVTFGDQRSETGDQRPEIGERGEEIGDRVTGEVELAVAPAVAVEQAVGPRQRKRR